MQINLYKLQELVDCKFWSRFQEPCMRSCWPLNGDTSTGCSLLNMWLENKKQMRQVAKSSIAICQLEIFPLKAVAKITIKPMISINCEVLN